MVSLKLENHSKSTFDQADCNTYITLNEICMFISVEITQNYFWWYALHLFIDSTMCCSSFYRPWAALTEIKKKVYNVIERQFWAYILMKLLWWWIERLAQNCQTTRDIFYWQSSVGPLPL